MLTEKYPQRIVEIRTIYIDFPNEILEGSWEVGGGELIMFVRRREKEREGEALLCWRLEVRWAG